MLINFGSFLAAHTINILESNEYFPPFWREQKLLSEEVAAAYLLLPLTVAQ